MTHGYRDAEEGESGLRCLLAPNPSPMTADGTNTYLIGHDDLALIDPGPLHAAHLDAIVAAVAGRPVRAILVTHAHVDHSEAAPALAARLGHPPVLAFGAFDAGRSETMAELETPAGGEGVDRAFRPDAMLADGDAVAGSGWTLRAHHTPGHMANHLSFEWPQARAVFTGDTVMGWASTMISPPDGDLGQFMTSLKRLEAIDADVFHPGHGGPVCDPAARCRVLRAHRLARNAAIHSALPTAPTVPALVAAIYADTPAQLHAAAARNVFAHLIHLAAAGRVRASPAIHSDATWKQT